mgnify:CR=1 FL=1
MRTMLTGIDRENTSRMVLTVAREGIRAKSYREAAITLQERFDSKFSADLVRIVQTM